MRCEPLNGTSLDRVVFYVPGAQEERGRITSSGNGRVLSSRTGSILPRAFPRPTRSCSIFRIKPRRMRCGSVPCQLAVRPDDEL